MRSAPNPLQAPRDEWERVEANRLSKAPMVVRPANGVIQPFSKVEVEFTFQPPETPVPRVRPSAPQPPHGA